MAHLGEFLPPLVAFSVYAGAYGLRVRALGRARRPVPHWRIAGFTAGVLIVTVVQIPPLDGLADSVLIAHMVQHILIGDIASFLVVIGLTGPLLAPWLALRAPRALRSLGHPVVAFVLWGFDLYVWHVPLLYQLAIRHDMVHALEHTCLFWFGFMLWFSLLGPLPKPSWFGDWAKLGYVVGVRLAGALLANALLWTQSVMYPYYDATDARQGLSPLSDQNVAGGIMMVEQMILTALLLGWLFHRAANHDETRQQLLDLAADRGVELTDARATRAAATTNAAAHLRERLLDTERRAP